MGALDLFGCVLGTGLFHEVLRFVVAACVAEARVAWVATKYLNTADNPLYHRLIAELVAIR